MFWHRWLFVLALAALVGCRSTQDVLADYEGKISQGQYREASVEVAQKAEEHDGDELLWRLLTAGAWYLADDRREATRMFDVAEDLFAANDQASVYSKTGIGAYAMMTSDRAFPYAGGGQDRIFTCLYKAIDFAALGNVAAARTELNRAAQHQSNWRDERGKEIADAAERMSKDSASYARNQNIPPSSSDTGTVTRAFSDAAFSATVRTQCAFDPAVDGRLECLAEADYMNAYVQYVCGMFRQLAGDGGREYLKTAARLKPGSAMLARELREADAGIEPSNVVWIFVEDGLCPAREERRFDVPLVFMPGVGRYVPYVGMALPRLRYRNAAATAYSVTAGGGNVAMSVLEDVDHLIKSEFDVYMRGAVAREVTRVVCRTAVQAALGAAAQNTRDGHARAALVLSQLVVAGFSAATVGADVRSWTTLPKQVFAARLDRPSDGVVVVNCGLEKLRVDVSPGNTMIFVRKPSSAARAVVKSFTFPGK